MSGFPRVACYAANRGYGFPLVPGNSHASPLDMDLVGKLARHDTITLDLAPWWAVEEPPRVDALLALRRLNPSIRIIGYLLLGVWRLPAEFTVNTWDKTFWGTWHNGVKDSGGHGAVAERNADGTIRHWWVRWENPATEAALTKLLCDVASSHLFDGIFGDYFWATTGSGADALQRMTHSVRSAGGRGFLVLGNGPHADTLNTDGAFREGVPDKLPGVDFPDIQRWRSSRPHRTDDWVQSGTDYLSLDTPDAKRAARFAHGIACHTDSLCSFGKDRDVKLTAAYPVPYLAWWNEIYDGGGLGTGWLGEPRGDASLVGFNCWRRDFAGGTVLVNASSNDKPVTLPKGLCRFDGTEMGSVTVPARDAVFLRRAQ